jgi:hypothetical protein
MPNTYTWTFPAFTAYPVYESQTDVVYIANGAAKCLKKI